MSIRTIKHIIMYFLVFIVIIGLTSTFTAKEFINTATEVGLESEQMIKMQVVLNDALTSSTLRNSEDKEKQGDNLLDSEQIIEENIDQFAIFQKGDTDEKIREFQDVLSNLGYLDGKSDGMFGLMTEMAVLRYQKEMNLEVTGKLDSETQKALKDKKQTEQEVQQQDQQDQKSTTNNDGTIVKHIVKSGETFSHISEEHKVSVNEILQANNLPESAVLQIDQVLIIPNN